MTKHTSTRLSPVRVRDIEPGTIVQIEDGRRVLVRGSRELNGRIDLLADAAGTTELLSFAPAAHVFRVTTFVKR